MALGLDAIQQGIAAPRPDAPEGARIQRAATSRRSAAPRDTAQSA
jgi:hypothetical protein